VVQVAVTPATALLAAAGETRQFAATAQDADGNAIAGKTFTWGSSNEAVASVSSSGLATAVAGGSATITATVDGKSGTAAVTVEIAPSTGGLRVVIATLGRNPDPDGYSLTVEGVLTQAVASVDTVVVGELDPGTYAASVDGLAANCYRFSNQAVQGTVEVGDTVEVTLGVECLDFPDTIALTYTRASFAEPNMRITGQPAAGGAPEDLTFSPAYDEAPDWSPDGSMLAFSRDGVIFIVNADGTGLRSFAGRGPGAGRGSNPAWSPDGTTIAYDNESNIYVIEVDGADAQVDLGAGYWPAWSPDGSQIAFEFYDPAVAEPEIFVMNADGTGRVNLSQHPALLDREPSWSPDGSQIVFRRGDRGNADGYELFVMDADGGNQTEILSAPGPQLAPLWLPDNRIIYMSADADPSVNGFRIWQLDLDAGGTTTQLTFDTEHGHSQPAWRPTP
jgi:Tol biopolymer transport system component